MSIVDLLLAALLRAQVAAGVAVLLVLALRRPGRVLIGAELTYRLWAIAPVAAVVSLFPTLPAFMSSWGQPARPAGPPQLLPHAELLLLAWVVGAVAMAALLTLSEARFRRLARLGRAGPAVMGVHWPRIVTPAGYAAMFTAAERALIDRHERAHIARRDPRANLFLAAMRVLGWFNPLVHVAVACARLDQELACDAAVIQARPDCRRDYGATLLKAHLVGPRSPFSCAWMAAARHPLEIRLSMLARPPISLSHYLRGAAAVALVAVAVALGVWSLAPGGVAGPGFDWTAVPAARGPAER
jgi:beta-lactamase regulating signal transducer with metallopeptidase domain